MKFDLVLRRTRLRLFIIIIWFLIVPRTALYYNNIFLCIVIYFYSAGRYKLHYKHILHQSFSTGVSRQMKYLSYGVLPKKLFKV